MKHQILPKSKNALLQIAAIGLVALVFSSCKKKAEDTTEITTGFAAPTTVAIKGSTTALYTLTYPIVSTTTTIPISISYSQTEAPKDITVVLGLGDEATITQYNTEQGKSYVPMDADLYAISASSVVIPKGKNTASFNISVKTSMFALGKRYALPLKIKSVSYGSISKTLGNILLNIVAKNDYDGIFNCTDGTVTRYTAPGVPANDALSGSMKGNPDVALTSIDANTVQLSNLRWAGGTSNITELDNLQLIVDPTTKQVTVKSLGNTSLKNTAGKDNKYNPSTRTFTLNFDWNEAAAPRAVTELTLKYSGARP